MCFRQRGLVQQADAADFDFAAVRQQTAGQHLQRSGFSRAVVPEQAQHFSALQFQRHVLNDQVIAEAARQVACGKGYFGSNIWQSRVVLMVVSLAKYNLLCAPTSKAVLL